MLSNLNKLFKKKKLHDVVEDSVVDTNEVVEIRELVSGIEIAIKKIIYHLNLNKNFLNLLVFNVIPIVVDSATGVIGRV